MLSEITQIKSTMWSNRTTLKVSKGSFILIKIFIAKHGSKPGAARST